MRVVLLSAGVRGIGTYCMNLYNELVSENHEVLLISESKWEKAPIECFYQPKSTMVFGMAPLVYKPSEIIREIQQFKPDLIHYHWPCSTMDLFFKRVKNLGVPILVTIHVSISSRKNILDRFWYFLFGIFKKWIPQVEMVNCISGFIRNQLALRVDITDGKVRQVYAGIDEQVFKPGLKNHDTELKILFIGQIMPEKGIDVLVRAVMNAGVHRRLRLNIIGRGPLEKKLRHLSRNHSNIHWIGFLKEQSLIAEYYAQSDVTVMPTRWDEAFSLVPLESLACGTPVIATEKGGTPEVIRNGETGYLLSECDLRELTDLLRNLDTEKLRSMRDACRSAVLRHHTLKMMGEKHIALYSRLLDNAGSI